MNWDDLRFLVTLGREGTLAAAARQLGVDQTTVARRLRTLEQDLGTPLFERNDGLWRPTAVGGRVLERVGRIEEDVAGISRLAEAGAAAVGGVVRITAVGAFIGDWLVPRLPGLYTRHPELCVDLVASNDNLNVARREADIAIRLARPASGDLLIRKLADVGFALYGAARGDLQVSAGDWVAYNEDLAHTPEMRRLKAMLGSGRIRLRANSVRGLARAVADGVGQGLLPCFLADPDPRLARLSGPHPVLSRELWMLIHPDARPLPRVAATADWLVACFGEEAGRLSGVLVRP
ncbi:LysR family transcriptional regulator [Thauera propionica]|jgi:DNA-binding transcriptional LysR family regulator|uniref:LysR family transcriptional regulator n=1 Tax=Thauera propionica TaxID=2019431 RepID=A0A235F4G2_9RHOO|nr:LysR family transcriptional regulator [Thauera propionica]OYD55797.1 LysR family transcriptional regulator [Thauera propionica]